MKESLLNPKWGPWGIGSHMMGETIPKVENKVTLDKSQKDQWGIPLLNFDIDGYNTALPRDAMVCSVCFAGYDTDKGHDDVVCLSINTYWEDVTITLPKLPGTGAWYLSVNTFGDGEGRTFYPECDEIHIDDTFILRPRSVAVFTARWR